MNLRQVNDQRRIAALDVRSRPSTAPDAGLVVTSPGVPMERLNVRSPSRESAKIPRSPVRPRLSRDNIKEEEELPGCSKVNEDYSATRKAAMRSLSERDQSALKLGRMVLSAFEKPEVTSIDSFSRFWVDTWLAKSGSSLAEADSFSIELLSNLQKNISKVNESSLIEEDQDQEEKLNFSIDAVGVRSKKAVAAVSLEAFDRVIAEFGRSNPILNDIKEAIIPMIFVEDPSAAVGGGNRYLGMESWCEDAHNLLERLRQIEESKQFSELRCQELQREAVFANEKTEEMTRMIEPLRVELADATRWVIDTTRTRETP